MLTLTSLVAALDRETLLKDVINPKELTISRPPVRDSRLVQPEDVFVAICGNSVDGHMFIDKAVLNGANAIICEVVPGSVKPGITLVCVDDSKKAWAVVHKLFHRGAAERLNLIGVTGTNGKTTTTYLIHSVLEHLDVSAGLIGTIENRSGKESTESSLTTPDPADLHRLFGAMTNAGDTTCVMEVSSHALVQDRTYGLHFNAGVFTNLSQDHLDYHGDMDEYLRSKKILFDHLLPSSVAVYNASDPNGAAVVADTSARKISFGLDYAHDYTLQIVESTSRRTVVAINDTTITLSLLGEFNAWNATAAYATLISLGYPKPAVESGLAQCSPVPGRLEQIFADDGRTIIVDYAHTPDALQKLLETTRKMLEGNGKLICVFGCGGDRDKRKRPIMGHIAEKLADTCVVTADNPRGERQQDIASDIKTGFSNPLQHFWIESRYEAIEQAVRIASPTDLVVIAGKGHEAYQVVGDQKIAFDDREVARGLLRFSSDQGGDS